MPKKQKVYMPPQVVRNGQDFGDDPVTLDQVKKLYRSGKDGNKAGMQWARRVLRQEGILKASTEGDVFLPVAIDLQLGPEIFAGFLSESVEEVAAKFEKVGISASCLPFGDGTLACFSDYSLEDTDLSSGSFPVEKVSKDRMIMVDESKAKIKSIMRSVWQNKEKSGYMCYEISDPDDISEDIKTEKLFLLKSVDSSEQTASIIKVDSDLGLVLGWAIISTIDGDPYFDKQGDHIPDESMLQASTDFMLHKRVMGDMHVKENFENNTAKNAGTVVFCWPMTAEIAKAFGIDTCQTGLMIAVKPDDEEVLEKYRNGTYTGFSIGGSRIDEEEVD